MSDAASRPGHSSGRRRHQTTNIHRVHRHVGLIAGVDGGRQLLAQLIVETKSGGQHNHHLAAGYVRQALGEAAQPEQHAADSKGRLGVESGSPAAERRAIAGSTDRSRLRSVDDGTQLVGVVGEILGNPQGAGEIGHGDELVRAGIAVDEFLRRGAGLHLVAHGHRSVIEEEHQVVLPIVIGRGGIGLVGEAGDLLFFVVFENFEVLLRQIGDIVALLVGDHGVHQDQPGFRTDHRRGGSVGNLLRPPRGTDPQNRS